MCRRFVLLTILLLNGSRLGAAEPDAAGIDFFEKKIRPVLVDHCFECHSDEAKKAQQLQGELLLDTHDGLLKGGKGGAIIVPGKPNESRLIKAIRHEGERKMPKEKLADAVIADFTMWVAKGAPMPRDLPAIKSTGIDWEKARQPWAYQLPVKHPQPKVRDSQWPRNEIDFFILADLEKRGLKPVPAAGKREWIRRATFDLIGLPPTPEEIENFLREADAKPQDAYQKVVDRLLASPHYGERWGRYWLDVARYADDKALAIAKPSPHAFRYREWVIQALNQDMPYDEFLKLQLAGDLLPNAPADHFKRLAGLGFQGLGAEYHKGNFAAQVMADELDDRVDTLTRGLLGLTVACARCHDHKYDPIPARDYFSLAAAYQGASMNDLPLASTAEVDKFRNWEKALKAQEADLNQWLLSRGRALGKPELENVGRYLLAAHRIRVLRDRKTAHDVDAVARAEKLHPFFLKRIVALMDQPKVPTELIVWRDAANKAFAGANLVDGAVVIPDDLSKLADEVQRSVRAAVKTTEDGKKVDPKQNALLKELWLDPKSPFFVDAKASLDLLGEMDRKEHASRLAKLEQHKKEAPPALVMIHGVQGGGQAMRIHLRGRVESLGEEAPPGFLRILQRTDAKTPRFTRLELANAIATPQNPLTARVFVNRVWQHHFGRGIVGTPSNFGKLGDAPTHPELLDTLVVRFIESGWSIKWLHREIMLSAAYRLGSANDPDNAAKDPENHYLWRMSPHRLDVEAWRDALLAVSGRLDPTIGGASFDMDNKKEVRRTIYAKISRSVPNTMLTAFDFPDANVSSAKRSVTTVPQQQLFALNSEMMFDSAKAFATRLEKAVKDDESRIVLAYRLAYGREPTEAEKKIGREFLQSATESKEKLTPWEQYAQAILAANEFVWVE